jgi:large subunit ribosomal protein L9
MKVVFLEEVEGTAHTGDVKNVANGFARNFLLPRKLAAPATDHYITIAQSRATKQARVQTKLDEDAQKIMPLVDGKELIIEVRVGEQDKLFGSVTARDVAELLIEQTKIELEHKQVDIKQPIRALGSHSVPVKLTRNVVATVVVHVIPIGGSIEDLATEEEAAVELEEADDVVAEEVTEEASEESEAEEEESTASTGEEVEEEAEAEDEAVEEEAEAEETSE